MREKLTIFYRQLIIFSMTKRAIFYDTETTGLKPDKDRVIEIAAYDPQRDQTFESLVNPSCSIPAEASAICNITDEMVKEAPPFSLVASDFMRFCEGDVVLIAHNNDLFDQPFLESEFHRHQLSLPQWPYIDSLKFARKYRPDLPGHSLQHLREYHGIKANQAHRALDDVIVLHQVFSQLIDDLPIDTVLELMNQKQVLRQMPFGKYRGRPLSEVPPSYISWLCKEGALDKPDKRGLKEALGALGLLP